MRAARDAAEAARWVWRWRGVAAREVENGGENGMAGAEPDGKIEEEQKAAEKYEMGEKGQAAAEEEEAAQGVAAERLGPVPRFGLGHQPPRRPVQLKNPDGPTTRSDGAAPAPASRA